MEKSIFHHHQSLCLGIIILGMRRKKYKFFTETSPKIFSAVSMHAHTFFNPSSVTHSWWLMIFILPNHFFHFRNIAASTHCLHQLVGFFCLVIVKESFRTHFLQFIWKVFHPPNLLRQAIPSDCEGRDLHKTLFIDVRREMIQFTLMLLPMADDKANKKPSETSWRHLKDSL